MAGLYVDDSRAVQRELKLGEKFDRDESKIKYEKEQEEKDLMYELSREEVTKRKILQ